MFTCVYVSADHQKLEREARICRLLKHPNIGELRGLHLKHTDWHQVQHTHFVRRLWWRVLQRTFIIQTRLWEKKSPKRACFVQVFNDDVSVRYSSRVIKRKRSRTLADPLLSFALIKRIVRDIPCFFLKKQSPSACPFFPPRSITSSFLEEVLQLPMQSALWDHLVLTKNAISHETLFMIYKWMIYDSEILQVLVYWVVQRRWID